MFKMVKRNEKGFTLIELMIVIAIIGILAAIAIPQLSAYRTRAFNSAAVTDITNLQSSEATLFSDWTMFGGTEQGADLAAATGGAPAPGALITAPPATAGDIAMISASDAVPNIRALKIGLSNGVSMIAGCSNATNDNFTSVSKHVQGNITYGIDSDVTMTYQNPDLLAAGDVLLAANLIAPVASQDDYVGLAAAGWAVK